MHPYRPARTRQHGAALMVMLVVMIMGIVAILVGSLNSSALQIERDKKTTAALAQAREALIGYAITYGDTHPGEVHGYLPCPDNDGVNPEGSAEPSCGSKNISMLGRLPWKTLGLPPLRDGDGECLWYAVSGTYKNNPQTGLMNWDTNGQLQAYAADGTRLDNDNNQVLAVIFSPGTVHGNQNRTPDGKAPVCGGNYTASAYLDENPAHGINNASVSSVASAVSKFIQGGNDGQVNDRMVFITRQDLWNAMQKRLDFTSTLKLMTQRVAECIADYGRNNNSGWSNKSIPWPALISMSDYSINLNYNDRDYSDVNGRYYAGRVPYKVNTSNNTTNNHMSGDNLMTNNGLNNCPYHSATPSNERERLYPWWNNWKDHLFYALSREFRPNNAPTDLCGNCVRINGSGNYAAVVMFAGSALSGQNRASTTTNNSERSVLSNYLEGRNESNYPNYGGNDNYQTATTSPTFNDILYCIRTDLNVMECPPP
ncbi:MAG TPA: hypothetical protein VEP71_05045 [Gallionella sp.]|nr:hypothetical protein [Gallionella sp.]